MPRWVINESRRSPRAGQPASTRTVSGPRPSVGALVRDVPAVRAGPFAVEDDDVYRTILATGDFTRRPAAGYPGLPTELPVDVLLLTGATNESFGQTATEIVEAVMERVLAGAPVLVTASALTGVQLAYWLGHYCETIDERVPVQLAGHVATVYEDLEYEVPGVETSAVFEETDQFLGNGTVTIAGPEVPVEGSSARLFEQIRGNANAALVQVTGGGTTPVTDGRCTSLSYTFSNHPSRDTIDDVLAAYDPIHTVIVHQRGPSANRFTDHYDSYVWATDDSDVYCLFDEGGWHGPPWVTETTVRRVESSTDMTGLFRDEITSSTVPVPTMTRSETVSLDAEGIDRSRLDARFESQRSTRDSVETEPTDADESDPAIPERLTAVERRLDSVEQTLDEESPEDTVVEARVVDAGDDVTLLCLLDSLQGLSHGDRVTVAIEPDQQ